VFVGRDSNGRIRHKSHTFQGSKRAAEKELARLVLAQEADPQVVPDEASRSWGPNTTINDAIGGWKANGWDDLSPVTSRRYESIWKVHIEGTIGKKRISSLSPYDVEKYFRRLKADGAGRETVRYVRSVLHRACRLARKWSGNQLHNPVTDTELPSWGLEDLPMPVRPDCGGRRTGPSVLGGPAGGGGDGNAAGGGLRAPLVRHRLGAGDSDHRRISDPG
jgi:hypothetical protein